MLINSNDFGKLGRFGSSIAMHLFGLHAVNKIYAAVENTSEFAFAEQYFENEHVKYSVEKDQLQHIPEKEAVIVIANHPTGLLDGLIMLDILLKKRPDAKILGHPLLQRLVPVQSHFIKLDPFDRDRTKNISGIKTALEHLQAGGLLMLFPAGEVSTWHRGFCVTDRQWSAGIAKIIRWAEVPIVPVYLGGKNSFRFHFLGKIHHLLRTAQIPRELVNKKNKNIPLVIGAPILPCRAKILETNSDFADFLRNNVYLLKKTIARKKEKTKTADRQQQEIAAAQDVEVLKSETAQLRDKHLLFEQGNMRIFFAPPDAIPHIIKEIGRLREITFREVDEGTGNEADLDKYDNYYWQLFVWDNANNQIVGGYRLGLGAEIMKRYGRGGFYTHSLFRLSHKMEGRLEQSIELGRSFVVKACQRNPLPLLLLWKGILTVLLNHKEHNYLIGAVSISNA